MKKPLLYLLLLLVYGAVLFKLIVLKDVPLIRVGHLMLNFGGTHEGEANLMPFRTILPYLLGDKGWIISGINLAGNILLLVPVGFLLPLIFPNINWKIMLVLALSTGFLIEGLQVLLLVGIFDIDDVLLNGSGVMAGHGVFKLLSGITIRMTAKKKRTASLLTLVGVLAIWAFAFSPIGLLPISFAAAPVNGLQGLPGQQANTTSSCCDLCGGTGGTGEIIGLGEHAITIKRKDGVIQRIGLGKKTSIKTSAGPASARELKKGDHVTVIIGLIKEDSMMASAILVCQLSGPRSIQ